jgi:hypothetical protein
MKLGKPARKMILVIIVASLVFTAGGAVFYRSLEALAFAAAVILMAGLNVLKVIMLERTVKRTVMIEEASHGKNYARLQYILRLILTAVVLIAAARYAWHTGSYSSIYGSVAGVLTFQIAAFSLRFFGLNEDEREGE